MNPNDAIITVLASGKIVRHVPLAVGALRQIGNAFLELADSVTLPPSEKIEQVDTNESEE